MCTPQLLCMHAKLHSIAIAKKSHKTEYTFICLPQLFIFNQLEYECMLKCIVLAIEKKSQYIYGQPLHNNAHNHNNNIKQCKQCYLDTVWMKKLPHGCICLLTRLQQKFNQTPESSKEKDKSFWLSICLYSFSCLSYSS